MEILSHSEWKQKVVDHNQRVLPYVEDFRGRRARRKRHPVNDFLFTYYSHRPGQLLRWSPGIGFGLEVKGDASRIGSHFKLENKIFLFWIKNNDWWKTFKDKKSFKK